METPDLNDAAGLLARLIRGINRANSDVIPTGYHTVEDYAKAWKKKVERTQCILRRAMKLGLMERQSVNLDGKRRLVYREIKSAKG